jgi:triosephosphate isomerase
MLRTKIVAGNWKMHLSLSEGINLVNQLTELYKPLSNVSSVRIILATPAIHLAKVTDLL